MSKRSEFEAMIEELKAYSQHPTIIKCIDLLEKYKPKPYKSRKRSDCICGEKGRNITVWWHMSGGYWFCECPKCEIKAPGSKKYVDAIQKWNRMTEELRAFMLALSAISPDGGYGGIDMCITCKKNGRDKYKDTETGQEWDLCESCPNNVTNAYKSTN